MEKNSEIYNLFRNLAIFGNFMYILWMLYNAIDEGFNATIVMVFSYTGMIFLLILNITLLSHQRKFVKSKRIINYS